MAQRVAVPDYNHCCRSFAFPSTLTVADGYITYQAILDVSVRHDHAWLLLIKFSPYWLVGLSQWWLPRYERLQS